MSMADLAGVFVGFTLTLLVFSYLIGDNPLFRLVLHIFIGVAAGYAAVVVFYNVVWYQLFVPLIQNPGASYYLVIPPLLLGLWFLVKAFPKAARFGNPVMGYLVGAGAATAIGGAILGTLFPQIRASINLFDWRAASPGAGNLFAILGFIAKGLVILVWTLATLAYFHFGVRPTADQPSQTSRAMEVLRQIGRIFIAMTFGFLFAGVYAATLTALVNRMGAILDTLRIIRSMF